MRGSLLVGLPLPRLSQMLQRLREKTQMELSLKSNESKKKSCLPLVTVKD
jgi:hypothetical protein